MKRATWHLRVGALVAGWLLALAVVSLVGLVHDVTPWLPVHLLLLGAVSTAILIWSSYFADALLRLPQSDSRRGEAVRLGLFTGGAIAVVAGMVTGESAPVLVGGGLTATVAVAHAVVLIRRKRRSLPSRFGATVRYYVAAAALLPVGIALGVVMAVDDLDDAVHARVALAHVALNLLGWMGLTVLGTLVTLWPTMLHTRIADGAERASRRALPILLAGLAVVVGGTATGNRAVSAGGIVVYLVGLGVAGRPLVDEVRARRPATYATWSVLAGLVWLTGSLTALVVIVATAGDWEQAAERADRLGAPLLVGFAAQVLIGALSYLVPVVLGGGPAAARATIAVLDTAATTRLTVINVGLVAAALPISGEARTLAIGLVALAMAMFLPLVLRAVSLARPLARGSG